LLNSISSTTDLNTFPFFSATENADQSTLFTSKIHTLLTWSVSRVQFGDHRSFAAVTLLRIWRDKANDRAIRRDIAPPGEFIQDQLFDWLDQSDAAGDEENVKSVALLFGKLVKDDLFSYAIYLQRLIARGEPGLSFNQVSAVNLYFVIYSPSNKEEKSRHRTFLRWIPLHRSIPSLISQRKVALHGARTRDTPEDVNEREIRREIRTILPELFGGLSLSTHICPWVK
jgi:mediator of RNA polymerase II transcription subunit 12